MRVNECERSVQSYFISFGPHAASPACSDIQVDVIRLFPSMWWKPRPFPCSVFDGCSGKLAALELWPARTFPCTQASQNLECQSVGLELVSHLFLEWLHCVRPKWPQPCNSVCSICSINCEGAWICDKSVLAVVLMCLDFCSHCPLPSICLLTKAVWIWSLPLLLGFIEHLCSDGRMPNIK